QRSGSVPTAKREAKTTGDRIRQACRCHRWNGNGTCHRFVAQAERVDLRQRIAIDMGIPTPASAGEAHRVETRVAVLARDEVAEGVVALKTRATHTDPSTSRAPFSRRRSGTCANTYRSLLAGIWPLGPTAPESTTIQAQTAAPDRCPRPLPAASR